MAESIILQESSLDRLEAWRITRVVDGASESLAFGDLRLLAAGPMEVNDIERSVIGGFSMGPEVGLEVTAEYYGWTDREPYEPPTEEEELNGHEPEPQPSGPLVDPELLALVAAGSTERVEIVLSYDIGDEHLPLLRGEGEDALRFVEMNEDEQDAFRMQQWGVRSAHLRELAEPLLQFAESVDVEVIWLGELAPVMHLGGSPTNLLRVAEHEMVLRSDLNREGQTLLEDGTDVVRGLQMLQFHDINIQGGYSSTLARTIRIGVVDNWFNIDHVAFKNNSSTYRVYGAFNCDAVPCSLGVPTPGIDDNPHGSYVAAMATADLWDGQDSTITAYTPAAAARSGVSPESRLYVAHTGTTAGIARGMERMVLSGVNILTNAYGNADFMSCANNLHATAIEVNAAFENGITSVFPAGNAGHVIGACNDDYGGDCGHLCTLQPGASATGSLAVNAIDTGGNDDHSDYWTNATWPLSGNGGDGDNYDEPTRVDIVAPVGRRFAVHGISNGGVVGGYVDELLGGTSLSAPMVAGALAVWTEFAADHWSSAAVAPGLSYASTLLFGDGYRDPTLGGNDVVNDANSNALSNVTGAGRFRARIPTGAGMDSPWVYAWSSFSMTDYDTEDILANGGAPFNSDIDRYRHAFWSYESNNPGNPAYQRMFVRSVEPTNPHGWTPDSVSPQYTVFVPDRRDWKGRIDLTDSQINNRRVYTRFTTGNLPNETSRIVNYVRYTEDLDRDDVDGPASEIQ